MARSRKTTDKPTTTGKRPMIVTEPCALPEVRLAVELATQAG